MFSQLSTELLITFSHNLWGTLFALDNSVDKYKSPQFFLVLVEKTGDNWPLLCSKKR